MREILFRGYSIETNKWVYGYLALGNLIISRNKYIEYLVEPMSIGEWSGCRDINNIKIFENDIVKVNDEYHQVVFDAGMFCLDNGLPLNNVEVIGNSYKVE